MTMRNKKRLPGSAARGPNSEELLRSQIQVYETLLQAQSDLGLGLGILTAERVIYANDALCQMIGYTPEEFYALAAPFNIEPSEANLRSRERLQRRLQGEPAPEHYETRVLHKEGRMIDVELAIKPITVSGQLQFMYLIRDISARKQAEQAMLRKTSEHAALSRIGKALSRLAEPRELLELIYTVVGQILDSRNLYIALYDEASQSISFPVFTIDGERISQPARALANGMTEYVIRSRAPLFLPCDVMSATSERGIERHGPPTQCYLAVPMLAGEKVMGVIAIQDYERENVYDSGHLDILTAIASQAAIALENTRLFTETQRRADQLQVVNDVERVITTILDPDLLSAKIVEVINTKLGLNHVAVGLIEGNELVFKDVQATGDGVVPGPELRLKIGPESIAGRVAMSGESLMVPDILLDPTFHRSETWPNTRSELVVALKTQSGAIGVLNLESNWINAFGPDIVSLVETLASQLAVALQNARLFAETQRLARTDALTGIANRRYLFEVGAHELSRARRFSHPLSTIMLDIDHFKQVNDEYGHAMGDEVLRSLTRYFLKLIRDIDIVARYGGEEFVILLVETDAASARITAERLCEQVAQTVTGSTQSPVKVTISLGVAGARPDSDNLDVLLARADQALYTAKQAGGNRVEVG